MVNANIGRMEFRQLRSLVTLAELGSITTASERLPALIAVPSTFDQLKLVPPTWVRMIIERLTA